MGRSQDGCKKFVLKRGPWTPEEDKKLLSYIEEHGHGSWRALPARAGLHRCGKSCRLRWMNYLRPDIKRGKFSIHEEQSIIQLHALLGNRWSAIATHLPKRTDNEIKNYWNTHLKKRLAKMGIDPSTHKARIDTLSLSSSANGRGQSKSSSSASLSHMAQWESARLEAEARLARDSKLRLRAATSNPNATLHNKSTSGHIGLESPTSTLNSYRESMVPRIMSVASGEEASWLQESSGILIRSESCDWDLSSGFTEVLLDGSHEQNSTENAEDNGKSSNYWNSTLVDMVSSSPPSTSPPICPDSSYMFRAY